jgi:hypothetical protein
VARIRLDARQGDVMDPAEQSPSSSAAFRWFDRGVALLGPIGASAIALLRFDFGLSGAGVLLEVATLFLALVATTWCLVFKRPLRALVCLGLLFLAMYSNLAAMVFVGLRLREFEPVLAGASGTPGGAYDVTRFAHETVIQYPMWDNWSDSLHVVYQHPEDPAADPDGAWRKVERESMSFWEWHHSREHARHLWGPWYIYIE